MAGLATSHYVCVRCTTALLRREAHLAARSGRLSARGLRQSSTTSNAATSDTPAERSNHSNGNAASTHKPKPENEPGPMARRLEEATEEALFTGGRAGRRAVEDAGFSEELKARLLARVRDAEFRSENASAFAEAGLPASAGRGTAHLAASQPWTGAESTEDAVLRMLNDAHKPLAPSLRGKPRLPDLKPVDMRFTRDTRSQGQRAAGARDKAAVYAGMGLKDKEQNGLSEKERDELKKEFRERFKPAARAMPNTFTGLASLANERIEDAIARGQFKNIPRGKGVERDTRADNPFIDTTEYIMNKMIKRQDIVPPWIEKQQELIKTAHTFRTRLRNDWKRHAARTIASKGGALQEQMERARRYASAELLHNPRKRNVEQVVVPTNSTDDPVMVKVRQLLSPETAEELADAEATAAIDDSAASTTSSPPNEGAATEVTSANVPVQDVPLPPPFRDPDWLRTEQTYMDLSITNLNTITRSYNLMAPELAKKPYFSLERELNACYADVAPQLADAIKDRAARPSKPLGESAGQRPGNILDRFNGEAHRSKVYDSKTPNYGFREMLRDLFRKEAN
ncbi:hypothetical protein BKA67DRAFT_532791 [Truncatella angustata]|uniref:DnaJ homologue subfamily C member 28 conserved domain-containing protein n=1 Tax=Truncatella angustata TaxID=152316 RepID=A0A9P8UT31_9PEZI|nr:uncharacterized protein BKA67DRAFT_532791 [Truncatella angustata]KAH6657592.1 hypothetical protein BKA67DRAFT_532791 [Truncatella angustata]KAH8204520.1 hypothetical protein TruAng_001294 [Truncatella angustata]